MIIDSAFEKKTAILLIKNKKEIRFTLFQNLKINYQYFTKVNYMKSIEQINYFLS